MAYCKPSVGIGCDYSFVMDNSTSMSEIAKLKGRVNTEQINLSVDKDLRDRLRRLKEEKRINTAEEMRKALSDMVRRLESAVL